MRTLIWLVVAACSYRPSSLGTPDGADDDAAIEPDMPTVGPDWMFNRILTIDNSNNGALIDFPLAVVLTPTRIQYSPAGADLRFQTPGGTVLPYEIEQWKTTDKSVVWVRVPSIAA